MNTDKMKKSTCCAHKPDRGQTMAATAAPRIVSDANRGACANPVRQPAFRRDCLPSPLDYYASQGLALRGRGAWRDALCLFHPDTHPSLRVNVNSGAFRCMACGASGGDVLAYHMRRHGLRFVDAAKELGAWEVTA